MKEIPEGLVKPDNITEEAFKKWFNYFLQTFDSGYEPQSVPDSLANGDLTPDNGTRKIPVSMTNAIRTLLDFGLFEYVADRVTKGVERLEADATKAV